MARPSASAKTARLAHRYVGFFLSGIMAIYAISGVTLIFRNTETFKLATPMAKTVSPQLDATALGEALDIRRLRIDRTEASVAYFKNGSYNLATGEAVWTKYDLPVVLDKMTHLHKATTNDPLYWLNISFGVALLGFVVTAFWMYMPGGTVMRKGLFAAAAGAALTVAMLLMA